MKRGVPSKKESTIIVILMVIKISKEEIVVIKGLCQIYIHFWSILFLTFARIHQI